MISAPQYRTTHSQFAIDPIGHAGAEARGPCSQRLMSANAGTIEFACARIGCRRKVGFPIARYIVGRTEVFCADCERPRGPHR